MNKISNEQIGTLLKDAAALLRVQQARINEQDEKLASRDRRDRVEKIAQAMHAKNLEIDVTVDALADRLEKAANLEVVEQAVAFCGPDMTNKLAQLTNDGPGASSAAASEMERFIVGEVG
jgi:hypothetical protein